MVAIKVTSYLILYLFLIAAAVSDLTRMKISNRLILLGLLSAIPLSLMQGGIIQIFRMIPNILFPVILLYPLFRWGVLGAGDIKLFSLIGGFYNFKELVSCIGYSFVSGALISCALLLLQERFREGICKGFSCLIRLLQGEKVDFGDLDSGRYMHFSIAILIGALLSMMHNAGGLGM